MKLVTYGRTLDVSSRINYVLTGIALLSVLSTTVLAARMFYFQERVVLVPPEMNERMEVSWNAANEAYFKSWGLYAATLFGNVTPKTAPFVADQLGSLLDARVYTPVRQQILALAQDPKFTRALSFNYFSAREIQYEPSTKKVFVIGALTVASYSVFAQQKDINQIQTPLGQAEQRPVVYEMGMTMRSGRPVIVSFNSYPGSQPRTQRWLELNGPRLADERKRQEAAGIKVMEGAVIPLEVDTSSSQSPAQPATTGKEPSSSETAPLKADPNTPILVPSAVPPSVPSSGVKPSEPKTSDITTRDSSGASTATVTPQSPAKDLTGKK